MLYPSAYIHKNFFRLMSYFFPKIDKMEDAIKKNKDIKKTYENIIWIYTWKNIPVPFIKKGFLIFIIQSRVTQGFALFCVDSHCKNLLSIQKVWYCWIHYYCIPFIFCTKSSHQSFEKSFFCVFFRDVLSPQWRCFYALIKG